MNGMQEQNDYRRIAQAIAYLDDHYQDQPGLGELAGHLHLSPYHLQRLFRRWAGISPKRFVQFLTLEHAKKLLSDSCSVLDAAYDSGLSGPGRLHDLFVAIDAVTPGEFKAKGAGVRIDYGFVPSPFGECLLAATRRGVCHLSFADSGNRQDAVQRLRHQWGLARLQENPQSATSLAKRIFHAEDSPFRTLTLFLKGTNFQIKVWESLLRVPRGRVATYEQIAQQIGRPRAVRAVANAVGPNPVAWLIPCHRVIRKSGALGGYRWGQVRKKALLGWEAGKRR
ncbi:MAG: bifunctional helix-turn-helix domain-containing protein/methylated-DNA--[protein]-cysteine S-methyltransferase [Acidobacteriota bacterium]